MTHSAGPCFQAKARLSDKCLFLHNQAVRRFYALPFFMPYKLLTLFCKHSILATGLTQPKHIPLTTSQLQPCKTLWHETGRNIWQKGPCCMAERHILQHETVNIGTHSLACKNLLSHITPLLCTVKSVTMTANAKEALHSAKPESSIQLQNAQQLDESQNLSNEKKSPGNSL